MSSGNTNVNEGKVLPFDLNVEPVDETIDLNVEPVDHQETRDSPSHVAEASHVGEDQNRVSPDLCSVCRENVVNNKDDHRTLVTLKCSHILHLGT